MSHVERKPILQIHHYKTPDPHFQPKMLQEYNFD